MIIRFTETHIFWRVISCFILPKYKANVYNATTNEIKELKEWLKFQGVKYTSDTSSYYSANNILEAETTKPKITIYVRSEDHLMAIKLTWC